jgi:hypothetical protein
MNNNLQKCVQGNGEREKKKKGNNKTTNNK